LSDPRYGAGMSRIVTTLFAAVLFASVAACQAADPGWPPENTNFDLIPAPVSTEIVVGSNRMLFNILDASTNQSIASADQPVELRFYDFSISREQPASTTSATFMPTVEGRPGLYRAQVDFSKAGEWGVEAVAPETGGADQTGRFVFQVREQGTTPAIGAPAIAVETPTASTAAEIAQISTDDHPDADFYKLSVDDAIAAEEPFALVFATPAFCTSQTCGPTLDLVKSVASGFKDRMNFINVEPYELESVDGSLRPVLDANNLPVSVPATVEWGLPTEPYIFVVDAQGKVSAKFEGIASEDELEAAFEEVAGSV
jgi:hypothetical protein